jgi:hypothetical protein
MRKTTPSSFTRVFLITLLLTGASIASSLPLIYTEAFAEKKGLKHDLENDDKKNYQDKYKQYDFEKYLSNQYEVYKGYAQYYEDLLYNAENPQKHPYLTHENVKEQDDNQKQKHSERDRDGDDNHRDDDANGKSSSLESTMKDIATKYKIYKSYKSEEEVKEKKTYKNIKIIECSNLNLNNYDVKNYNDVEKILNAKEAKDWSVVKEILNKETTFENNDDAYNHMESHKENSNAPQEYNIGSETKIIFLCTNENLNREPTNDNGNDMIRSLPDEGIMLPISSHTKNDNNNDNDVTTTPIVS